MALLAPSRASATRYTHTQAVAALSWTMEHNLAGFPDVTTTLEDGTEIQGDVHYVSDMIIVVSFGQAYAGFGHLN